MSGFSKRLFDTLDKLNEMGQLLLVVNNLPNFSESEKKDLKSLAISKDQKMLKSLTLFKKDHNIEILTKSWKSLISKETYSQEEQKIEKTEQKISFLKKNSKNLSEMVPGLVQKVKKIVDENSNLLKIRDTLGLDKKDPKQLISSIKNIFKTKEFLTLEDFSDLILKIEETSEQWSDISKKTGAAFLFDLFDENKNKLLSKEEIFNNIIILSGGSPIEKISSLFILYDKEKDGLISYENILEHQKFAFKILFLLRPKLKNYQTPEALALATTESIFLNVNGNEQLISENEYLAWYNKKDIDSEILTEKAAKIQSRKEKQEKIKKELEKTTKKLTSNENLSEIHNLKTLTGLGKVPVHDALRIFKQKNTSGYFSRQQFSNIITEIVQKYNFSFKLSAKYYDSVYKLFTKFDIDKNGVMDTSEIFCGLSIVCAGNLGDKIKAACDSFDQSGDGEMQFSEVVQYFKVVFNMVFGEDQQKLVSTKKIAKDTTDNLFAFYKLNEDNAVNHDQIRKWVLRTRVKLF